MDFSGKARHLERKLTRSVQAAIGELVGGVSDVAPLEIVHAVLDRAEHEVQDIGRGRRVFPFNIVHLAVLAGPRDKAARGRLDAVLAGPPSLAERVRERLASAGCGDVGITTETVYVKQSGPDWEQPAFHVTFDRVATASVPPPLPVVQAAAIVAPRLKLTVLKGSAAQRAYVFNGGRIDIGRRADVIDQRQRLIRTNQVAFSDEGDENSSVSRRHAHVGWVEAEGSYRVWDDRSAHGTSVVRGGRTMRVPAGARGLRIASGDEIVLGHARLRVTLD